MNVYCVHACAQLVLGSSRPPIGNVAAPSGLGLPDRFMKIILPRHASVDQPNADNPSLRLGSQMIGDYV